MDTGLIEAFIEDADDDRSEQCAKEGAPATTETCSTDGRCGNGVQLESLATRWLGAVKLRGLNGAGDPSERAAQNVGERLDARDGDTGKSRGLTVAAERVEMLTVARAMQQHR